MCVIKWDFTMLSRKNIYLDTGPRKVVVPTRLHLGEYIYICIYICNMTHMHTHVYTYCLGQISHNGILLSIHGSLSRNCCFVFSYHIRFEQQIPVNYHIAVVIDSLPYVLWNIQNSETRFALLLLLFHEGLWAHNWKLSKIHFAQVSFLMMTSSNGSIFRVTGPLCGEFTGLGEFPTQRPVTRSFDVFFDLRLNKRLSKQPWGWWFETPS